MWGNIPFDVGQHYGMWGRIPVQVGRDSGEVGQPDSVTPPVRQPSAETAGDDDASCHRRSSVLSLCRTCSQ